LALLAAQEELKVILVSAREQDPRYVAVMMRLPVCGYLLKSEFAASLLEAIHTVADGRQWYSPAWQTARATPNDANGQADRWIREWRYRS
jgi:DNA-binding NarL/FixJ family response regulator